MTDRIRTLADEAMALHNETAMFAQGQAKLGFEAARASMKLTTELQQKAFRASVDAWLPTPDAAE